MKSNLQKALDILKELQWHHEPYDDYYHKDQGYYCPDCGADEDQGHHVYCELSKVIQDIERELNEL